MVDNKYGPDNYKTLKKSIGTKIKNAEMLSFVSDHLKTKKICRDAVKNLPFVIWYVLFSYKTQKMCD